MQRHPRDLVIRLIALFKLVKAAMLIALGIGALSMRNDHSWLGTWIHAIAADPHGKYITELIAKIGSLNARNLEEIGIGSLLYAGVFTVEGIGLLLRKMWAEVLTVIITTSFIPLEVYELATHRSWAKAAVIVVNVLVVLYLLRRLRREHHWPFHHGAAPRTAFPPE
ncbi:MAG TPA: DUF2127 domain-containing protein [Kofleriaceae bacterium]|jgi:uncharacterized membrane protein (DUF2068 family)|nr:DUF2127 domain-containing protein [Kofleriaceae bacterium]